MNETKKTINFLTIKDFKNLHCREWNEEIGEFDSIVVLPSRELHESGYRLLDFVAVLDGYPVCRLSGCSDILEFNGIGGYGKNYKSLITIGIPWSMDCLKKSGLLNIWANGHKLSVGSSLSSFSVYARKENKNKDTPNE